MRRRGGLRRREEILPWRGRLRRQRVFLRGDNAPRLRRGAGVAAPRVGGDNIRENQIPARRWGVGHLAADDHLLGGIGTAGRGDLKRERESLGLCWLARRQERRRRCRFQSGIRRRGSGRTQNRCCARPRGNARSGVGRAADLPPGRRLELLPADDLRAAVIGHPVRGVGGSVFRILIERHQEAIPLNLRPHGLGDVLGDESIVENHRLEHFAFIVGMSFQRGQQLRRAAVRVVVQRGERRERFGDGGAVGAQGIVLIGYPLIEHARPSGKGTIPGDLLGTRIVRFDGRRIGRNREHLRPEGGGGASGQSGAAVLSGHKRHAGVPLGLVGKTFRRNPERLGVGAHRLSLISADTRRHVIGVDGGQIAANQLPGQLPIRVGQTKPLLR